MSRVLERRRLSVSLVLVGYHANHNVSLKTRMTYPMTLDDVVQKSFLLQLYHDLFVGNFCCPLNSEYSRHQCVPKAATVGESDCVSVYSAQP